VNGAVLTHVFLYELVSAKSNKECLSLMARVKPANLRFSGNAKPIPINGGIALWNGFWSVSDIGS
jgi:hypothetical protein